MKTFVELESTRYWHAKILKEIKEYRRQKGREAAASDGDGCLVLRACVCWILCDFTGLAGQP